MSIMSKHSLLYNYFQYRKLMLRSIDLIGCSEKECCNSETIIIWKPLKYIYSIRYKKFLNNVCLNERSDFYR